MIQATLDTIKTTLSKGMIRDGLDQFHTLIESNNFATKNKELHKKVNRQTVLLKIRFNRLEEHNNKGFLKYEEYDLQLNKITDSIFNLIEMTENLEPKH